MRGMALACLLVAALARAAAAQAEEPGKQQARTHYLEARRLHEHGEYQRAAAEYLQAFALFPDPELLFNVGQVYRLAGDQALATAYYRRYLELDPEGRAAPEARRHLEAMGATVRAGAAAKAWGMPREQQQQRPPAVAPVRRADRGGWLRWTGIASGGVGLVLLGAGIYYGIEARSISAELSLVDRWTADRLDRFDDGERAEARAIGFSIAGGALLVGGGVLYWLGHQSSSEIELGAAVGAHGEVTALAGGRF